MVPHVLQYDETQCNHGYVNVTYNNTLLDAPSHLPAWKPYKENEKGERITDPQGVLMMKANTVIDLNNPPEVEVWRHGDIGEAEGLLENDVWKKDKV